MAALAQYYLFFKAVHIISVIVWLAGLLYLPRLFVVHTQVQSGSEADEKFVQMEKKLLRAVINPASIVVFAVGILLIIITGAGAPGSGSWMHLKLTLVLGLGAVHGMMSKYRKAFERGENVKSEAFFRGFKEVPSILMIAIVFLAIIKPF